MYPVSYIIETLEKLAIQIIKFYHFRFRCETTDAHKLRKSSGNKRLWAKT